MTEHIDTPTAYILREIEHMNAVEEATRLSPRSARRKTGPSIPYCVRLDPEELGALETRAIITGIKPSVLARNLIRSGLASYNGAHVAAAVDRLEAAVRELRSAVP